MEFICNQCPRNCSALRRENEGDGYCRMGYLPRIARAALHFWEEPCISGTRGSGTVFFSGCSLGCIYCQNYELSQEDYGEVISVKHLADIFKRLEDIGAHNINLVNPTHYVHSISEALDIYKSGIPIVYNTSGYDSVETLRCLEGLVDVYLPDFKYTDKALADKLSGASDYPETACEAIDEMYRQVGGVRLDSDGIIEKGVIIRHLVLPGFVTKSIQTLRLIKERFPDDIYISVMSQYTPAGNTEGFNTLSRRLTSREYERVLEEVDLCGFRHGFFQELSSANEEYIPDFDLTGI
ncbi:MAG: radical SAM protein [Clostridiales bacterium]|nr:radical SAM protein [Clostridiales bacterium]